jgi:hypothetical protein
MRKGPWVVGSVGRARALGGLLVCYFEALGGHCSIPNGESSKAQDLICEHVEFGITKRWYLR